MALPTLNHLLEQGADVTVLHPPGTAKGAPDERWDMAPVRDRLAELAPRVSLLENLRFDPGEAGNDPSFVEKLVNGHDAYVNEAFGVSHRSHASVVGPPTRLPSAAGFLLQRELRSSAASSSTRPGRSWPSWAAPRWPTSWACSGRCSSGSTPWWWAGDGLHLPGRRRAPGRGLAGRRGAPGGLRRPAGVGEADPAPHGPGGPGARRRVRPGVRGRGRGGGGRTSPKGGAGSTSAPRPSPPSAPRSPGPGPCCGTGRWGCSRTTGSPPAPPGWRWP